MAPIVNSNGKVVDGCDCGWHSREYPYHAHGRALARLEKHEHARRAHGEVLVRSVPVLIAVWYGKVVPPLFITIGILFALFLVGGIVWATIEDHWGEQEPNVCARLYDAARTARYEGDRARLFAAADSCYDALIEGYGR